LARLHGTPHPPQCVTEVSGVSHPLGRMLSQFPHRVLQVGEQSPETQALTLVPALVWHTVPQAPQLLWSLARSRQNPLQQALLAHWFDRLQEAPTGSLHWPATQLLPGAQSALTVQLTRQTPVPASQA
jgi:hypothetical protein